MPPRLIITLILAAALVFGSARPAAAAPGEISGAVPSTGGVGLVLWGGGAPATVGAAASGKGCALQSFWVAADGAVSGYVQGAPEFVNTSFVSRFAAGVIPAQTPLILVCASGVVATPSAPAAGSGVAAPPGTTVDGATWIAIDAPGGKTILAAVFRPSGQAPAPAVVVLHGTAGLSNNFLRIGKDLAANGYVAVVGCWFGGHFDGSTREEQPTSISLPDGIDCPNAPVLKTGTAFLDDIAPILRATHALPGVRPGAVAIMGHSRGSVAALTVGGTGGDVRAVIASAGTVPGVAGTLLALGMSAPVLLLQGEADTTIPPADTRAQEAALRAFGRPVQAEYYAGAGHGYLFETQWHDLAVQRMVRFLREVLG